MEMAKQVLNTNLDDQERAKLIRSRPEYAADLLRTLVADIQPGTKQESARIPLLWEIAVVAAEKNNREMLSRVLDVAMPKNGGDVAHWQIAVIGGGLIFQLSKNGADPKGTIEELVSRDPLLSSRWKALLRTSRSIIQDDRRPIGVRYDALRIFSLSDWEIAKQVYQDLFSSIEIQTEDEKKLRLAAVTAAPDFNEPETTEFFVNRFSVLTPMEREKVCVALSRNEASATRLLRCIKTGVIPARQFPRKAIQCFRHNASNRVRQMAAALFQF